MIKVLINEEEVICNKDFTIKEEMLNTPSVILNNVYPKTWETAKDYTTNFYHPEDYSKCKIIDVIPLLPSGYTQVDYIQSTGTQYIDTGLFPDSNLKVETKIEVTSTNQDITVFGSSLTSSGGSSLGGYYHLTPYSNKWYYGANNSEGNGGSYSATVGTQYEIIFNDEDGGIKINGTSIASNKTFVGINNSTLTIARRGTASNIRFGRFKYFYFKIYNKDTNALVRDYIPCYRNSDNEVGMYDLVNNVFYTNAGTGTFTKGNDVQPEQNLLFCGVVKNSGNISLNPREPHYSTLQILDFKTFLSEGETLDFVIANKTILEAIEQIIDAISEYGFVLGNVDIQASNDVIGAYSTLNKTAYDVFNYIADITQSRWTTRMVDEDTVAIDFYDPNKLPLGTAIDYNTLFFCNNLIDDITYSYNTQDYRNKQVMTSNEVYGNINQIQTIIADGYATQFLVEQKIGQIQSISVNGVQKTFTTNTEKQIGYTADFYYTTGNNTFESASSISLGSSIVIEYIPIIRGRQIITNNTEISRISTVTDRKGVVARYENRSDATTNTELRLIGESYIRYKGEPEILLTVKTRKNLWNVGNRVQFNAPIQDLALEYMVKAKEINYITTIDTLFYTYTLTSSFNSESAINYFDNQRAKNNGNIGEGEYINRNIDYESSATIIFFGSDFEAITMTGDNELQSTLSSPLKE